MAVLKNNEYKTVFWGAKNSFITGLDPLGQQNTSAATFAFLLPGVTNLTNRIRYYGFYCWLLEYYAKHIRDTEQKKQNDFIRKAELMIAILMKTRYPDYVQITGSNFAFDMIAQNPSDYFDLESNAVKQGNNKTYWKYSSGAFGQYYAGAMHGIGLIIRNDSNNYICTNTNHHNGITGAHVAEVFQKSIDETAEKMFVKNIVEGKLPVSEMNLLTDYFALNHITEKQEEWNIYCNFLLQEDHPLIEKNEEDDITFHRRNTIHELLKNIDESESFSGWADFTNNIYLNQGGINGVASETLQTWFFYNLNEFWHYGAGAVFWAMLYMLGERYNKVHISHFVHKFSEEIIQFFEENVDIKKENKFSEELKKINVDVVETSDMIKDSIKEGDIRSASGLGISLIFSVFNTNKIYKEDLQQLAHRRGIIRDGNIIDFMTYIESYSGTFEEFIRDFIYRNMIYRHQYVAIRKTGSRTLSTLKFLLEESFLKQIEVFEPSFTSPRLGAILYILQDLNIITDKYNLTETGRYFLNNYLNGNS